MREGTEGELHLGLVSLPQWTSASALDSHGSTHLAVGQLGGGDLSRDQSRATLVPQSSGAELGGQSSSQSDFLTEHMLRNCQFMTKWE